jgi:hypothetical protein
LGIPRITRVTVVVTSSLVGSSSLAMW